VSPTQQYQTCPAFTISRTEFWAEMLTAQVSSMGMKNFQILNFHLCFKSISLQVFISFSVFTFLSKFLVIQNLSSFLAISSLIAQFLFRYSFFSFIVFQNRFLFHFHSLPLIFHSFSHSPFCYAISQLLTFESFLLWILFFILDFKELWNSVKKAMYFLLLFARTLLSLCVIQ